MITQENGWVKDDFEKSANGRTFISAVNLPKDAYDALTPVQIEAIKQQMFDDWLMIVENEPPSEPFDELAWLASVSAESSE